MINGLNEINEIAFEGITILNDDKINNDNNISPNNIFLHRIYDYYYEKGFGKIFVEKIKSLLIHYFLLFFILFLTNCIDYSGIYNFNGEKSNNKIYISNFINIENWLPQNLYFKLCLITYLIYIICHSVNTIITIKNAWHIRNIYINKLGISSRDFDKYKWSEIVDKIVEKYPDPNLQINTINSRVCIKNNIITSLLRSKIIKFPISSTILEWNMIYCFVNTLFDKSTNESEITNLSLNEYVKKTKARLKLVFIINLISLPFTLYIFFIYTLINYGEKIYNDPDFLTNRICAISGHWKMMYYNELPHYYDERQEYITKEINELLSVRRYAKLNVVLKLINFVLASIFVTIIIISLLNEKILTESYIYGNRTLLWGLGILTTLIVLIRKNTQSKKMNNDEKKEHLLKLSKKISSLYPNYFECNKESWNDFVRLFSSIYQYHINFIIMELIYIILSPLYIYIWYTEFDTNMADKIRGMITEHYIMGNICKQSIFSDYQTIINDPHVYYSVIEFHKRNPEWKPLLNVMPDTNGSILCEEFNWLNYLNRINDKSVNASKSVDGVGLMDTLINENLSSAYFN